MLDRREDMRTSGSAGGGPASRMVGWHGRTGGWRVERVSRLVSRQP